jgi:hypothetical protein
MELLQVLNRLLYTTVSDEGYLALYRSVSSKVYILGASASIFLVNWSRFVKVSIFSF